MWIEKCKKQNAWTFEVGELPHVSRLNLILLRVIKVKKKECEMTVRRNQKQDGMGFSFWSFKTSMDFLNLFAFFPYFGEKRQRHRLY